MLYGVKNARSTIKNSKLTTLSAVIKARQKIAKCYILVSASLIQLALAHIIIYLN